VSKKKKKRKKKKSFVLSVRFPPDKLPALDRYVSRLQREHPGGNWTRSSAGLGMILRHLETEEAK
jgi:hypothetical protein